MRPALRTDPSRPKINQLKIEPVLVIGKPIATNSGRDKTPLFGGGLQPLDRRCFEAPGLSPCGHCAIATVRRAHSFVLANRYLLTRRCAGSLTQVLDKILCADFAGVGAKFAGVGAGYAGVY